MSLLLDAPVAASNPVDGGSEGTLPAEITLFKTVGCSRCTILGNRLRKKGVTFVEVDCSQPENAESLEMLRKWDAEDKKSRGQNPTEFIEFPFTRVVTPTEDYIFQGVLPDEINKITSMFSVA